MRKKTYPPLTEEQKQLVEDNVKLVPFMFGKNTWVLNFYHDSDEAVADGYFALVMAAMHFHKERGIEFNTYATRAIYGYWARQKVFFGRGKRFAEQMPYSLDKPVSQKHTSVADEETLGDTIPSNTDIEKETNSKMLAEKVKSSAKQTTLCSFRDPDKAYEMWHAYYFWNYNAKEIARAHHITHQRVHEVIRKINNRVQQSMGGIQSL